MAYLVLLAMYQEKVDIGLAKDFRKEGAKLSFQSCLNIFFVDRIIQGSKVLVPTSSSPGV